MAKPKNAEPSEQQKLGWTEPKPANVGKYASEDLIDWLAVFACEHHRDWGFIKDELLRRLGADSRSQEQGK